MFDEQNERKVSGRVLDNAAYHSHGGVRQTGSALAWERVTRPIRRK